MLTKYNLRDICALIKYIGENNTIERDVIEAFLFGFIQDEAKLMEIKANQKLRSFTFNCYIKEFGVKPNLDKFNLYVDDIMKSYFPDIFRGNLTILDLEDRFEAEDILKEIGIKGSEQKE